MQLDDIHSPEASDQDQAGRSGIMGRVARLFRRRWWFPGLLVVAAAVAGLVATFSGRTTADAIIDADGLHAKGMHDQAILAYQRALVGSDMQQRFAILERIVRCAQDAGDEQTGIDAALKLLYFDQHA